MDKKKVKDYGLKAGTSQGRDYGKFGVPSSGVVHNYAGCMQAPFKLHISDKVRFSVCDMQIISHPFLMML